MSVKDDGQYIYYLLMQPWSGRSLGERRTLDDEIRTEDTHGCDTNTRLGSAVRGTQAGEDDGCCAAHGTEEGL